MELAACAVTAVTAYLLGSIPTGYLAGRAKGIDIREVGSGNIGATNVFRTLGTVAGVLVMLVDMAKGFLACWLVAGLGTRLIAAPADLVPIDRERLQVVAGVAAILGHNYTCWLRFKGGKGVATTAGVLLGLFPRAFLIALAVWLVVLAASRFVSLASMAAAVALPFAVRLCGGTPMLTWVAGALGLLAIWKHRSNIRRLLDGTEHRFGKKKPPAETQSPEVNQPGNTSQQP